MKFISAIRRGFFYFLLIFALIFPSIKMPVKKSDKMDFAVSMGNGWNLGNTFDAYGAAEGLDTETCWGNPKTTKEMIDFIASEGFKTLRIPITWQGHFDYDNNYKIDREWLDRINEVVTWALDDGLKVIINTHHDVETWLIPEYEYLDSAKEILSALWTQIAEYFEPVGEDLIFETMNEPHVNYDTKSGWKPTDERMDCVNQLNEVALSAIRSTGGNNETRYVIVAPYAAGIGWAIDERFVLPDDDNLFVEVHFYCQTEHSPLPEDEGDCAKGANLDFKLDVLKGFSQVYERFVSKGIPVVNDEFGWTDHENIDKLSERMKAYMRIARACSVGCCVWDSGGNFYGFSNLKRTDLEWELPEVIHELTK